jgi:hypothetical protein
MLSIHFREPLCHRVLYVVLVHSVHAWLSVHGDRGIFQHLEIFQDRPPHLKVAGLQTPSKVLVDTTIHTSHN